MTLSDLGQTDFNQYRVQSRREIIALIRAMQNRNQLVTLLINGGSDAVVTSILDIDEDENLVIIDRAPSNSLNERILASKKVSFESVLDSIRILFPATGLSACLYDDLPALCMDLPSSLVRLQRREYYRVPTPVATPVRCRIDIVTEEEPDVPMTIVTVLANISAGGLALVDEKKIIETTIGIVFDVCRLELPGAPPIDLKLQIRNSQELTYANGKSVRRLGCQFVNPSKAVEAAVQRYITKLERDQNARNAGTQ